MLTNISKHRRLWTSEEDQALIYLKDQLKMKKWTQISKKMLSMFNLEGRTQKQCRDRYVNFLKNAENSYVWTSQDQTRLCQLYYELGNKWSQIAAYFPKTNGIFIKNKFYSRLRRAIRHLNLIVEKYFSQQEKPFQFDIIFKLVNNANHKSDTNLSHQIKEILEANPKFYEDVIIKIIKMTQDNSNYVLKKRKLQRFNFKDQIMWKKLIQILKFLQKQSYQVQFNQHFEKDFHLETHHNHHEGLKNAFSQQINDFLKYSRQSSVRLIKQNDSAKQIIQASYIQLNNINQMMHKRRNRITIISDQKVFDQKKKSCQNQICKKLLLKAEEVSQNKRNNMCRLQKEICLNYDSKVLTENDLKMIIFEKDKVIHM